MGMTTNDFPGHVMMCVTNTVVLVHTVLSAYSPQPGNGESPTLPGALKGGPDVDTPTTYH